MAAVQAAVSRATDHWISNHDLLVHLTGKSWVQTGVVCKYTSRDILSNSRYNQLSRTIIKKRSNVAMGCYSPLWRRSPARVQQGDLFKFHACSCRLLYGFKTACIPARFAAGFSPRQVRLRPFVFFRPQPWVWDSTSSFWTLNFGLCQCASELEQVPVPSGQHLVALPDIVSSQEQWTTNLSNRASEVSRFSPRIDRIFPEKNPRLKMKDFPSSASHKSQE